MRGKKWNKRLILSAFLFMPEGELEGVKLIKIIFLQILEQVQAGKIMFLGSFMALIQF